MNSNKILVWKTVGMRSIGRRREKNIKMDLRKQDVRMGGRWN
jgi:hypothetical protein